MPPRSQVGPSYALSTLEIPVDNALSSFPTRSCLLNTYHVTSAASEVSSILEARISGTAVAGNVEETGRVLSRFFKLTLNVSRPHPVSQVSVTVSVVFGV